MKQYHSPCRNYFISDEVPYYNVIIHHLHTLTNPSGKGFETSNYVRNRHKLQSLCVLMLYSKVLHVLEAELPSRSSEDILVKIDD